MYMAAMAEGESYILGNAGWQDMHTVNGSCAAVIAYTYDVTATSGRSSSNAADQAALQSSNVKQSAAVALNKNSMTIGEGWTDQDLTLQNATGTVTWVSGNEAVAKVSSTGKPRQPLRVLPQEVRRSRQPMPRATPVFDSHRISQRMR